MLAVITENTQFDSATNTHVIYYQFYDSGKLIRANKSIRGNVQGKNVEEFKPGDNIEILYYNGQSILKGYAEWALQPVILAIIALVVVIVVSLRKRLDLTVEPN